MRASFTRIALVLTGLWMAIGFQASAIATEPGTESPQMVISEPSTPANLTNYTEYYETADTKAPAPKEAAAPAMEVNCGPGCGTCESGCQARWILGVEAVWLSPQQLSHPETEFLIEQVNVDDVEQYSGIVSGLFITPRITLGYQGECWGIQTRYWRMNESNDQVTLAPDRAFDGFSTNSKFKAETLDLEATRMICWRDTTNQLSFGIRYAQLEQSSRVEAFHLGANDSLILGSAYARQKISGPGLTLGLAGYKPLPCRNFSLFYSARGSMIFDDSSLNAVETRASIISADPASAASVNGAIASGKGNLFIGEIQIGTQWNFELCKRCSDAFVRLALEYQYWDTNDTGFAYARSFALDNNNLGVATAASGDSRLGLAGFTVATGFSW